MSESRQKSKSVEPDERQQLSLDYDDTQIAAPPAKLPGDPFRNSLPETGPVAPPQLKPGIIRRYGEKPRGEAIRGWLDTQLATEMDHGTAFLFIPVAMIIGVSIYLALPVEPAPHNIALAVVSLIIIRVMLRGAVPLLKNTVAAGLIVLCAMALMQMRTEILATPMLGSEISTRITGQIRAIEHRPNGSARYTIDLISTERPELRYAPDRIRLTARSPLAGANIGGGIHGYARLRPPSGAVRPQGYDFAFYNYFDGIGANGFFLGAPDTADISAKYSPNTPILLIERARYWLASRIRAANEGASGAVSAALITGDKAAIPEETNEILRTSGLAHILSISGLHMALVAGTVMIFLRTLFALAPDWAAGRPIKKYAAIAGFAAISIYLFLAGASVATQRSFIMLAVMLGALLSDRSALTMRNLAIAAIIVILVAPEAVLGPSFQMSFAATLALIGVYGWWSRRKVHRDFQPERSPAAALTRKTGGFLLGLSVTSLVAGTATGIYAAYHFQRVAVLGLLGNLLAMPVVSLVTMPLAILGTLLIPFGLDGYVYALMNWSVKIVIEVAATVSKITPAGSTGALSTNALMWLSGGMLVLCLMRSHLRALGFAFLIPAGIAQANLAMPLMVISEDARQVAIIDARNKRLLVNRDRPSSFIMEQWQAAYITPQILRPKDDAAGFECRSIDFCIYSGTIEGVEIVAAYLQEPPTWQREWREVCGKSNIIIAGYAPFQSPCGVKAPLIMTAQQLALQGSAEIFISKSRTTGEAGPAYKITHAQGNAARPWQSHRKYSREARNLGPYRRN